MHFSLYAGLGWLVVSALRTRRRRPLASALLAIALFAGFDEWHQRFFGRDPGLPDWIADVIGASAGVMAASRVRDREAAL